jgi:hypothetical protein
VKLDFSPTSPYVRKVMACAIIRGLDGQIVRKAETHLGSVPLNARVVVSAKE